MPIIFPEDCIFSFERWKYCFPNQYIYLNSLWTIGCVYFNLLIVTTASFTFSGDHYVVKIFEEKIVSWYTLGKLCEGVSRWKKSHVSCWSFLLSITYASVILISKTLSKHHPRLEEFSRINHYELIEIDTNLFESDKIIEFTVFNQYSNYWPMKISFLHKSAIRAMIYATNQRIETHPAN